MHTENIEMSNELGAVAVEDWQSELDSAIQRSDETAIWSLMDRHASDEALQAAVATMVTRQAYSVDGSPVFSEIFLMPVIEDAAGAGPISNTEHWEFYKDPLSEALRVWVPRGYKVSLFPLTPMDHLTTWSPKFFRNYLRKAIHHSLDARIEYDQEEIVLPENAPRLGFITMVLSQGGQWPEGPDPSSINDARLKSIASYAMQTGEEPPIVLVPQRLQYALTDGICLWLDRLNEKIGVKGYLVHLSETSVDVVRITLKLDSTRVPFTQFVVRLHQVGHQGLQDILNVLAQIATNLEAPLDVQESNKN